MNIYSALIIVLLMNVQAYAFEHVMYIVRHAEPDKDYYGLSDAGKNDALNIAKLFNGIEISHIYSSPLERTRQTAEIILKEIGFNGQIEIVKELNHDLDDNAVWSKYLNSMSFVDNGNNAIFVTHSPVLAAFKDFLKDDKITISHGCVIKVVNDGNKIKLIQIK